MAVVTIRTLTDLGPNFWLAAGCQACGHRKDLSYDDLVDRSAKKEPRRLADLPEKKQQAFAQLLDAAAALQRNDKELHSSLLKDTMKRKQPQFSEEYHGYSSFSRLLEDAEKQKLIKLRKDPRSGTYVIAEILE